jgi:hypothetical protein
LEHDVAESAAAALWRCPMWKIVAILMLTLSVMLLARLVYKAPTLQTRLGLAESGIELVAKAPRIPPLMYAGVRG